MTRWVTGMSGQPPGDRSAELRAACGDYDVFAQIDHEAFDACMFPQVFFLHTLMTYLPNACFILNTRPTNKWLDSVRHWYDMMPRLVDACPIHPRNETGLGEWYDRHKVRASLALRSARCGLEFNIDEDPIGLTTHLTQFFNINSSTKCLGVYTHRSEGRDTSGSTRHGPNVAGHG